MSLVMCSTTHVHVDALSKNFKLQNKQEIGRLRRIGVQTLCTTWRSFYSPYTDRRRKICADYLYLHRTYNLKIARNLRFLQINIRP